MDTQTTHSAESMTIRQAFEEIYRPTMRQASPRTIEGYQSTINSWERFTDDLPVGEITNRTLVEFRDAVLDAGMSSATFNNRRSHLRAILRRLGPQEYRNPLGEQILDRIPYVEKLREDREFPRIVTAGELNDLYRACDSMNWPRCADPPLWWRTLLIVGLQVALRFGDLTRLTLDRFDFEERQVRWKARKTSKRQIVPLHSSTVSHVRALAGHDENLFAGGRVKNRLYENWRTLQRSAGIKQRFGFHTLRKTAATLYEQAVPGSARFILGHSPGNVTDAYYINPMAIMREAVEKLEMPEAFLQAIEPPRRPRPFSPGDWKFDADRVGYRSRKIELPHRSIRCLYAIAVAGGIAGFDELRAIAFDDTNGECGRETIKSTISQLRTRLRTEFELPDGWDPLPWDNNQNGWSIALP